MKNLITLAVCGVLLAACTPKHNPETEQQLLSMIDRKDFFRLETALKEKKAELSPAIALYAEAHLQNAFNRTDQSLQTIDALLQNHEKSLHDTLLCDVLTIKYYNLFKQYRYREAAEALQTAVSYCTNAKDSANIQNTYNMVAPFAEIPPQEMHIGDADVVIPIYRNQFNHVMMRVVAGSEAEDFIFDTGAMLSTITESCAKRLGVRVMESEIHVGSAIGSTVQSKVGVADSLRLGGLLLQNVAFLVVPDETLSFPEVNYYIHGIIGFPVMYQMKEVTIRQDESITVSAHPAKRNLHNLFLDGMSSIVQCEAAGDTVLFNMDTGARSTEFSAKYFASHQDKIVAAGTPDTVQRGGAGGIVEAEVYELKNMPLKVGGKELTLPAVTVLKDNVSFLDGVDGNLGQDVLMHFGKMVLNFEDMYLALEE